MFCDTRCKRFHQQLCCIQNCSIMMVKGDANGSHHHHCLSSTLWSPMQVHQSLDLRVCCQLQLGYRAVTTDYYMQQKYGMTASQVVDTYRTCVPQAAMSSVSGSTTSLLAGGGAMSSSSAIPILPPSGILSTSSSAAYKVLPQLRTLDLHGYPSSQLVSLPHRCPSCQGTPTVRYYRSTLCLLAKDLLLLRQRLKAPRTRLVEFLQCSPSFSCYITIHIPAYST